MDLARGAIDVWRADLGLLGEEALRTLSRAERERGEAILRPAGRARWMASRALLRLLLARYTGIEPAGLELVYGEHGKPALATGGTNGDAHLHFNLSHSEGLALYAFTAAGPVGIDVELVGRGGARDELTIATRVFGPRVARRLGALEGRARTRELLRLWVRHEAALKCLGVGLGGGGERVGWEERAGGGEREQGEREESPGLWIAELDLGESALAAVALAPAPPPATEPGTPPRVRRFEWTPGAPAPPQPM